MKKIGLLLSMFFATSVFLFSQDVVVAGWTFPGNAMMADTGLSVNLTQEISTIGGTSAIEIKNGYTTKAAHATGWDDGMDTKAWVVQISTEGYHNLLISSRQQSGGNNPGPKDYKIQYSIDGGTAWNDVDGGTITVENDWETSFVDNLALPEECGDLSEVWFRWIMTSNDASGAGGTVTTDGVDKIDEIYIRGEQINGIKDVNTDAFQISPNPASGYLKIRSDRTMNLISIYDVSGQLVLHAIADAKETTVDVRSLDCGIYILSITDDQCKNRLQRKIFISR